MKLEAADEIERLRQLLREEANAWRLISFAFEDERRRDTRRRAQLIEVALGERAPSDVIPEHADGYEPTLNQY